MKKPIGIFDSGIGGLTVLKEIMNAMPEEDTIYLGDTARVPYGTKSAETVTRYSFENARFLLKFNIKLLVVACNTASAYCLPSLQQELPIPVVGVIEPCRRRLDKQPGGTVDCPGISAGDEEELDRCAGPRLHPLPFVKGGNQGGHGRGCGPYRFRP